MKGQKKIESGFVLVFSYDIFFFFSELEQTKEKTKNLNCTIDVPVKLPYWPRGSFV
jgi:hypothetical protein